MNSSSITFDSRFLELFKVTNMGIWDWDLKGNRVFYSAEMANLAGYDQSELGSTNEGWENLILREDFEAARSDIVRHTRGETETFESDYRVRRKDGAVIWCRNRGKIIEYGEDGSPARFIGVVQDITKQKENELDLIGHKERLEDEIQKRTEDLFWQDKLLLEVNDIAKKLLAHDNAQSFDDVVHDCLRSIGELSGKDRVYIWKDIYDENHIRCCLQVFEWVNGVEGIQGNPAYENIPYDIMPTFKKALSNGECLNTFVCDLTESEKEIMEAQGIKAIIVAPIMMRGVNWGFIGIDNCEERELFSESDETMLMTSGFLIANAIQRRIDDAKMREADDRTQIMLNATPLCCNLWDMDVYGNISCIGINDETLRVFDLDSQQEYLDRFYELSPEFQPDGSRSSKEHIMRIFRKAFSEGFVRFEWLHRKLNGELVPSDVTLVRVKYKNRFIVAGYTRDLREQKAMLEKINKTQKELSDARDEAIANSKAKSEFLAKMSHEIRTPMNAIVGMSELILRENIPATIKDKVLSVKAASSNLLSIINDILDFSKIESGRFEIVNTVYSMASLVNDATNIICMRLADTGKPVILTAHIAPDVPNDLVGDEIRMRQVFLNILSNAVKYTKEGKVEYSLTSRPADGGVVLKFEVADTGIGIKEDDMHHLFGEFVQIDRVKNKGVEGTGLGLAISQSLCKLMGGTISASSVYGEGSVFTVEIPQGLPETHKNFAEVENPGDKSVLVYESRKAYSDSLARALGELGVRYTAAASQSQFYDAIMANNYSFVFFPAVLTESVKNFAENLRLNSKFVMLIEYNEEITVNTVKCLTMPAHSLSIANILNDVDGDNIYTDSFFRIQFAAPGARVLIVDDIETNLVVAEGLMRPYNMRIDVCESGAEAVSLVEEYDYDIVFMDHMMPLMDGIEATQIIRKNPANAALPIIALTANAISGMKEMFLSNGFDDFLAKPIEIMKLNDILEKWIPAGKKEAAADADAPDRPTFDIDGINVNVGLSMAGGSLDNYVNILSVFLRDGSNKINEIFECIENKDYALYTTYVHALKSALASIGAEELSVLAKSLEFAARIEDTKFVGENNENFLQGLEILLDNIDGVLRELSEGSGEPLSPGEMREKLAALREAVEEMDPALTDEIMSSLQRRAGGSSEIIKQIADLILLCEYDEAVVIIDGIISGDMG